MTRRHTMRLSAALLAGAAFTGVASAAPNDLTNEEAVALLDTMSDKQVTLIDAGQGERAPLRYTPEAGASSTTTITQRMKMEQFMGGMPMASPPLPETFYTLRLDVKSTDKDTFTITNTLEDAGVTAGQRGANVPMMGDALKALSGSVFTTTLDDRGDVKDTDAQGPANAPPGTDDQLQQIEALSNLIPFPEEPVAQGASWRQRIDRESNGLTLSVFNTYTLDRLEEHRAHLTLHSAQVIVDQEIKNPGLPPNTRISNGRGEGSATLVVDLTTGATIEFQMDLDLSMKMTLTTQGQTIEVDQTITSSMSAAPEKPE